MIIEECIQGSDDWHRLRCGVVTASNFGLILTKGSGKTRMRYLKRLRDERLTGRKETGYQTDAMRRGVKLEPRARRAYTMQTGNAVQEVGFVFLCNKRQVGGSPDGLVATEGGLEIKCPLPSTHEKYLTTGQIPRAYMAQIQGNLWITGRRWWDFVSFSPEFEQSRRLLVRRVMRDNRYIQNLATEVTRFLDELETQIHYHEKRTA